MSDVTTSLRLVGDEPPPEDEAAPSGDDPKVFARSISAPPGAPWDQWRAARLEARVGAPLPLTDIVHQLRRLDPWRPGRPAKFAAFYVRASDVGTRLKSEALLDGRWLEVTFVSRAEREHLARRTTLVLLGAGLGALTLVAALVIALGARRDAEDRLASLEQMAAAKERLARTAELQRRESSALAAAGMRGRSLGDYLADLDWMAGAKASGARLQVVHWERGVAAVEARGVTAPFVAAGRIVTKVYKPLRPGVWLWAVGPAGAPMMASPSPAVSADGAP
jgi:hypothetical protein